MTCDHNETLKLQIVSTLYTNPIRPVSSPCILAWSEPIICSTCVFLCPVLVDLPGELPWRSAEPRTCRCKRLTRPAQSIQLDSHHLVLTCSSVKECLSAARSFEEIPSEAGGASGPMDSARGTGDGYISAQRGYVAPQTIWITAQSESYVSAQTRQIALQTAWSKHKLWATSQHNHAT
jgi:hypothetical protein